MKTTKKVRRLERRRGGERRQAMSGRREMREREVELISQGRLWGKEKKNKFIHLNGEEKLVGNKTKI